MERADLSLSNSCLLSLADSFASWMMGIGEFCVESSSSSSSVFLHMNGPEGSSPVRTISWTRFDSRASAVSGGETPAMFAV